MKWWIYQLSFSDSVRNGPTIKLIYDKQRILAIIFKKYILYARHFMLLITAILPHLVGKQGPERGHLDEDIWLESGEAGILHRPSFYHTIYFSFLHLSVLWSNSNWCDTMCSLNVPPSLIHFTYWMFINSCLASLPHPSLGGFLEMMLSRWGWVDLLCALTASLQPQGHRTFHRPYRNLFFSHAAWFSGSYCPDQGSNSCLLQWKYRLLTAGPL